jgi:hypothetical protein
MANIETDWDSLGPSPEALRALELVKEEAEFPQTYSGQAWCAAYRIWKAVQESPEVLDGVGPYDDVPNVTLKDLDLTGFMFGWSVNAVRQMLGRPVGGNGAIVTIGKGNEPYPSVGSAEQAMKRALS